MNKKRHGLTIGIERMENNFYLSIKAVGKLTHEDYNIMTPLIDSALKEVKDPHVKVLLDGTELEGWELRAAWDDFRLGLQHGRQFDKIAVYGHKTWLEMSTKIGAWFMSGEIKYFENERDALTWLMS
ncbi:MAG: STAS/SEC14 domain-containing protein [Desulfuromonadales bacterium]|nr:STAS/SEC14 domain-containing protein [Desulfuromonadales bacterium]MBN2791949.1 STAS/SEC14 domain-containing protein [Desulfuromonadales bacterium]